jgi:YebC/PmpR family DNA-binding regulatory protein
MSGHSKWATIKRKKAKTDAERGKAFTKVIKEITIAARDGGGDPDGNPRLRTAILAAKAVNMPTSNIDRAVKKGTGELPGVRYEEHTYEGYGPAGVAIFLDVLSDNKNRTTAEIRHILTKHGGSLGEAGCVAWMFSQKGLITVDKEAGTEDRMMELALEAGAEDFKSEAPDAFEIYTAATDLNAVLKSFQSQGIEPMSAELCRLPQNTVELNEKQAEQVLKLMEALEDHDDVTKVWSNFDIPAEILEKMET